MLEKPLRVVVLPGSWLFVLFFSQADGVPIVSLWSLSPTATCADLQAAFSGISRSTPMSKACFKCSTSPSVAILVNISTATTDDPSVRELRRSAEPEQREMPTEKAMEQTSLTVAEGSSSVEVEQHPLLLCREETRLAVVSQDNERVQTPSSGLGSFAAPDGTWPEDVI